MLPLVGKAGLCKGLSLWLYKAYLMSYWGARSSQSDPDALGACVGEIQGVVLAGVQLYSDAPHASPSGAGIHVRSLLANIKGAEVV